MASRVNEEEDAKIRASALASDNMEISEYARRCALLGIVFKMNAQFPDEVQILVESMNVTGDGLEVPHAKSRKHAG